MPDVYSQATGVSLLPEVMPVVGLQQFFASTVGTVLFVASLAVCACEHLQHASDTAMPESVEGYEKLIPHD